MRILHVTSTLDRSAGTLSDTLAGLAMAQARQGAHVVICATYLSDADRTQATTLRCAGVDVSLMGPTRGLSQHHRQVEEIVQPLVASVDVVHIHGLFESIQHVAALAARNSRKPYVIAPSGLLDSRRITSRMRRDLNGAAFLIARNDAEARQLADLRLKTDCRVVADAGNSSDSAQHEAAARSLKLYGVPSLAVIANSLPPYRVALHQRIAREIPGVELSTLYTLRQSDAPWAIAPPAEINPVDCVDPNAWRRGNRIIQWLQRRRPNAVILNGYNGIDRLRVLRWCKTQQISCWLWGDSNIRGDQADGIKAIIKPILLRWAVDQASGVLACGSLGQAYFEKYGAARDRIAWMPYEPDYKLIQQLPVNAIDAAREAFGLPADRHRMVFCGRLIGIKRVDLVLDAFIALADERPDWDCVIVGDGPLRTSLAGRVPARLKDRVRWTGFLGDPAGVAAVLRASDVLVHPPDVEPWALVINEAAAAGMAIVASDAVGAAAELVVDGVNGFVVPSGDLPALVEAVRTVTDPARCPSFRAGSGDALAAWRKRADPLAAVQHVLHAVKVRAAIPLS